MKHRLILVVLLSLATAPAMAQLPKRDLIVELRQIEEGGAGYVVGTQHRAELLAPQQAQVRNGAKATFSIGQSIPLLWVESGGAYSASLAASAATASSRGGGMQQALTWMEAGQKISVLPRWPGGTQEVTVDVEVQFSTVDAQRGGAQLPEQKHSQFVTTLGAPLGQWVTLATTGNSPQRGVYGSEAASDPRRLLQLRVTVR
jgi:hypothetical protein